MKNVFKKIVGIDDKNVEVNYDDTEELYEDTEEEYEDTKEDEEEWLKEKAEDEGQLSIDVYQTSEKIVVVSTIAGVKPEDIDISINNDMLTIRGKRKMDQEVNEDNYLFKECYWGSFSRSVILPMEIKVQEIEANIENGVLTINLPKAETAKSVSIKVKSK